MHPTWNSIASRAAGYPSLQALFERLPRAEPRAASECTILEEAGITIAQAATDALSKLTATIADDVISSAVQKALTEEQNRAQDA